MIVSNLSLSLCYSSFLGFVFLLAENQMLFTKYIEIEIVLAWYRRIYTGIMSNNLSIELMGVV